MLNRRIAFFCALSLFDVFSLCADICTWTGGAGDGQWATAANWSAAVPATNDTALFTGSLTIVPPADFKGVVAVSNAAALTVSVGSDMAFSGAVQAGCTLVKRGAGVLTLKAAPGYFPGGVTVQEGTVRFAGNGLNAAPGFFGKLTVAAGATAQVVESPADTRHGALSFALKASSYPVAFATDYPDFAAFCTKWDTLTNIVDQNRTVYETDGASKYFMNGVQYWPSYYAGNLDYFEVFSRVLFVTPGADTYEMTFYADDYLMACLNGSICINNPVCSRTIFLRALPAGWNTMDTAFREYTGNAYAYAWIRGGALGGNILFNQNLLWKGVCFNGLDLQEGGMLNVADGQAVAFSALGGFSVSGTVMGGSGAYFSVMAGTATAAAARFTGFSGIIEVGSLAKADFSEVPDTAAFSFAGEGTVGNAAGLASHISADFKGAIDIPAETVFTNSSALSSSIRFTGKGTLVTLEADSTEKFPDFAGQVVVPAGATLTITNAADLVASNIVLSGKVALNLGNSALAQGVKAPIPDWNTAGCWSLNGNTREAAYNQGTAYVSNSVLVLTDDSGIQSRTANFTNFMVAADDVWQVKFTFSGKLLKKYSDETWAEGFSFFLQSAGPESYTTSRSAAPGGSYGFYLYQYRKEGTQAFMWIVNGDAGSNNQIKEGKLNGINFLSPIDFTVSYKGGVLTILMQQSGKSLTLTRDISGAFINAAKKYIGFGGRSYWGAVGASSQVYIYQTVSAFSGWVYKNASECNPVPSSSAFLPFSTDTWQVNDSAILTNSTQFSLIRNTNLFGSAVCKTPFSGKRAFRLEFDEYLDEVFGAWAEGISVFFQPSGTNIHYGRGGYKVKKTGGLGLTHYFYENRFGWYTATADAANSGPSGTIPKSLGMNHFKIFYDGSGLMNMLVTRGTSSCRIEHNFTEMSAMGDKVYLGFAGAPAGWAAYLATRVANPVFVFVENQNPLFPSPVLLQKGANATFSIGNLSTNNAVPSVTFTNVTLSAGSSLAIAATNGSCKATFASLALTGAAALNTGTKNIAELSTLVLDGSSPCTLIVTGSWIAKNGMLTIQVPAAWLKGGSFTVADFSCATYAGETAPNFALVDESGNNLLTRGVKIKYSKGILRVVKSDGTVILLKS